MCGEVEGDNLKATMLAYVDTSVCARPPSLDSSRLVLAGRRAGQSQHWAHPSQGYRSQDEMPFHAFDITA